MSFHSEQILLCLLFVSFHSDQLLLLLQIAQVESIVDAKERERILGEIAQALGPAFAKDQSPDSLCPFVADFLCAEKKRAVLLLTGDMSLRAESAEPCPNGHVKLGVRLLETRGYNVVLVRSDAWSTGSASDRDALLAEVTR